MSGCLSWHSVPSPTGGDWWHLPAVRGQNHPVASRWPGSFEVVAAPEHSSAVTNCSTCCDVPLLAPGVPPMPTVSLLGSPDVFVSILLGTRSSSFVGQWCCQGSTRSLHRLNYPFLLLQDSSPHLPVGHFCKWASDICPMQNMRRTAQEEQILPWPTLPGWNSRQRGACLYLSAHTPATHFLLLTLLFFVMLSACCLRWDERFLIVMAYSSRDKRVYFFLILDVLKTLYLHPTTFKRRQKWNEANNFSAPLIKQPQMI